MPLHLSCPNDRLYQANSLLYALPSFFFFAAISSGNKRFQPAARCYSIPNCHLNGISLELIGNHLELSVTAAVTGKAPTKQVSTEKRGKRQGMNLNVNERPKKNEAVIK